MNNKAPLISVIIPTYNRVNTVGNAINSALAQTYPNVEIIVVDDGSTDETEELIKGFPEIQYIKKPNGGQASARNMGLKYAQGKYIASLDSDDVWDTTFLEKTVSKIEKENLDFVFANWQQQQPDGNYVDYLTLQYIYLPSYLQKKPNTWVDLNYTDLRKVYLAGCPSPSSSLLIRATILKKMGWNEEMNIGDDWCMLLDIMFNNPNMKAAYTTEILWTKHINCQNIYDGRNRIEVLNLLHIKDKSVLIQRYRHLMTKLEIKVLEKEYVMNLIMASKEILIMNKDIIQSTKYVFEALFYHPLISCEVLYSTLIKKLKLNSPETLAYKE
jgi:glycosyltransferase involved in cell wall biosynthesis